MKCVRLGLILAALLVPGIAHAQLAVSAGMEYLEWEEDTAPTVSETGPLLALGIDYTQSGDSGFLFAYRGKVWLGDVDYEGSTLFNNTPIRGTTSYFGVTNEVQGRFRRPIERGYWADFVTGVGFDTWRRKLSSIQKEDYDIAFIRLGMDFDTAAAKSWMIGVGVKYPVWTREDPHLTDIGFDRNPTLRPGRDVSFYGQAGYRFDSNWRLVGYIDGYRFKQSNLEPVTEVAQGLGPMYVYQPASTMFIAGVKLEYNFR